MRKDHESFQGVVEGLMLIRFPKGVWPLAQRAVLSGPEQNQPRARKLRCQSSRLKASLKERHRIQ